MIRADGGLATSLQALGHPEHTPVDDWIRDQPDAIRTVQRAFVDAGAQRLLAPTFRLLPNLCPDWAELSTRAVTLARESGADEVWASFGPPSTAESGWAGEDVFAPVLDHLDDTVDGVLLETFVDLDEAVAATRLVRTAWSRPLAVTLVPATDGHRLISGAPLDVQLLLDAGADLVGFNCAPPQAILAAARHVRRNDLWLKPSWGQPLHGRELAKHAAVLGGCCGFDPDRLRRLFQLV